MAETLDNGDIEVREDALVWNSEEFCFTPVNHSFVQQPFSDTDSAYYDDDVYALLYFRDSIAMPADRCR
jgi:hypothetical protein